MEWAEDDGVVAAALGEDRAQEQHLLNDGHVAPNLGDGADPGAWEPTPPRDAEGLDAWARQGMQLWRSDDVVAAVQVIASDREAPRDLQAMALLWTLPVLEDEESWSAARMLADDPAIDRVTRVRLAAVLARELAARDDREAGGALDDVEHLALGADGDPRIEVAAARARVEIAAHGGDAGRIREAVDRLVAAAGAESLPVWVRDGALASAIRGLRRCAEVDANALAHGHVAAVIAAVRENLAGRRPPSAAAALVLLDAAALGLADDRADDALSLVIEAADCGGGEAPPGFRFAAALLASDATAAAKGPAEALVHQRRAIAIAHELDTDHPKAVAHRRMGLLLARLDRPDDADTHLSRAADCSSRRATPWRGQRCRSYGRGSC